MITEVLLNTALTIIKFIFGIIPSLPPMPQGIIDAADFFLNSVDATGNIMSWLYGPILWGLILTAVVALIAFEQIYHFTAYLVRILARFK